MGPTNATGDYQSPEETIPENIGEDASQADDSVKVEELSQAGSFKADEESKAEETSQAGSAVVVDNENVAANEEVARGMMAEKGIASAPMKNEKKYKRPRLAKLSRFFFGRRRKNNNAAAATSKPTEF